MIKKIVVIVILLGAASLYLAHITTNALKDAQHKQVSAMSIADQNN